MALTVEKLVADGYTREHATAFVNGPEKKPVTRTGPRRTKAKGEPAKRSQAISEPKPADVRAWARENNIDVPARGFLPRAVVTRYLDAQGT